MQRFSTSNVPFDDSVNRRSFLRQMSTLAAGSVLAGPSIIPSSVFASSGSVPPGDRIVVGIIGMGKMCSGHLGNLLGRKEVHIAALCDVETDRLATCRKRVAEAYRERYEKETYTGCDVYSDFRELIARPDIDAVLIATPTHWHAVMSVQAMAAGKDVYCEKPLSLTVREAEAVATAATRYGRIFQTGSQQRSDFNFRFACELVRNGCIGRITEIHVNVGGPPEVCYLPAEPIPPTLDWDTWVGPTAMRPYNQLLCPLDNYVSWPRWRYYWDFGGGGMTDWGAHHFDIAQWAMGMDGSGPVEVTPPGVAGAEKLTYRYANGTIMTHGGAEIAGGVDFIGTEGKIGVTRGRLVVEPEELLRQKWGPEDTTLYESSDHMGNWLNGVRSRRQCICPAEVGCSSVTVCHLGNIAYRLKRALRWNPDERHFVSDPAADRLLSRSMRDPWILS